MRRQLLLSTAMLASFVFSMPTFAQAASGTIARVFVQAPKEGMTTQYEAGRRNHMAWHRAQKDSFTWYTWEVLNGDRGGSYLIGTFGHEWKDFDGRDKFEAADSADAEASMGATQANSQQSYYRYRADMSRPDATAQGPSNMSAVTIYRVKPEGVNDFANGIMKVKAAQDKANWPSHSAWYQLVNGGEGPTFVSSSPRANWAAFQVPDKTLDALMEEHYGKKEGAAILASLRQAIRSSSSETILYRPDLSYVPAVK